MEVQQSMSFVTPLLQSCLEYQPINPAHCNNAMSTVALVDQHGTLPQTLQRTMFTAHLT